MFNTKKLTVRYLIALSLIALLIVSAHILVRITLHKQISGVPVINLAGRQRMLSQKLTKETLLLARHHDSSIEVKERDRQMLAETAAIWTRVHNGLQYGDKELKLPGDNSREIRNLFTEVEPYYQTIKGMVDKILILESTELAQLSIHSALIQDIMDSSPLFLEWMDRIVSQYDKEVEARVRLLKLLEIYILLTVLCLLSFEAICIFRPMVNGVKASYESLERADEELRKHHDQLEELVKERTAKLLTINKRLQGEIKERKQAEEAMKRSQRDYKALVSSVDSIVWEADARSFQFSFVSKQAERLLGYPTNRWLSEPTFWQDTIHPDDRKWAIALCKKATAEKKDHDFECRMIAADGRTVWLRDIVTVIVENDEPIRLRGIMVDITKHKIAEQEAMAFREKLQGLTSELSIVEERERRRLAAIVHDNIGQNLAFVKLTLQSLVESASSPNMLASLDKVCATIDKTIQEAHSLTFELSNPVLYELGLAAAVEQWLSEQVQDKYGIKCRFTGDGQGLELDNEISVILFQAVRELLVNTVKHAKAKTVQIDIQETGNRVQVSVRDDGVGFAVSKLNSSFSQNKTGGFGLFNIQERLEYLGGEMKIESTPTKGTCIILTSPVKRKKQEAKDKGVLV